MIAITMRGCMLEKASMLAHPVGRLADDLQRLSAGGKLTTERLHRRCGAGSGSLGGHLRLHIALPARRPYAGCSLSQTLEAAWSMHAEVADHVLNLLSQTGCGSQQHAPKSDRGCFEGLMLITAVLVCSRAASPQAQQAQQDAPMIVGDAGAHVIRRAGGVRPCGILAVGTLAAAALAAALGVRVHCAAQHHGDGPHGTWWTELVATTGWPKGTQTVYAAREATGARQKGLDQVCLPICIDIT